LETVQNFFSTRKAVQAENERMKRREQEVNQQPKRPQKVKHKQKLSKVFDLETVQNFFSTHKAVQAENERMKRREQEVNQQLAEMGDQLFRSQKA
jgi:hypothetical protein